MTRIWDWKRAGRDVSISWLIEPVQRRRVVDQDATARRFVRRAVGQEVEQNCASGLVSVFSVGCGQSLPQTIRSKWVNSTGAVCVRSPQASCSVGWQYV